MSHRPGPPRGPGARPGRGASPDSPASPKRVRRAPEKQEQARIRVLLTALRFSIYDTSQPFHPAITPGVPDIIAFGVTEMIYVEVKAPGGKLSPAQLLFRANCARTGTPYLFGDYANVRGMLKARGYIREDSFGEWLVPRPVARATPP